MTDYDPRALIINFGAPNEVKYATTPRDQTFDFSVVGDASVALKPASDESSGDLKEQTGQVPIEQSGAIPEPSSLLLLSLGLLLIVSRMQQIIDADPNDSITTINDVHPNDDFDGDGLTNDEEFWNWTDPTATTEVIADMTTSVAEGDRLEPFRMDLQLRIRSDNRPAKLVRDVTVLVDGTGRFETSQIHTGSLFQASSFPGRIYARTDGEGQFSIDLMGIEGGQIAFHVEDVAGGGGVVLPVSKAIATVDAPFLTATRSGRRLVFPTGQDSVEIRIADLAAALYPFSGSASATWNIGGISFEHVRIGKNGYLLLGQQSPLTTTNIDWQTAPDGLLAPFLDDLVVKSNSRIYVNWFWLTEPYFVVQWCRMGHALDPDAELTFQVQLWQRSGQVRFVYDNLANGTGNYADGHEAVIGVRYHQNDLYPWPGTVGILSALEVIESNAPLVTIIDPDVDQDFLSNEKEAQIGTDPRNWDSDHDRMSDAWENYYRPTLNPLSNDANEDADGDGYLNIIECYLGSKPTDPASPTFSEPDTDQDGMPDSWETTLIDLF